MKYSPDGGFLVTLVDEDELPIGLFAPDGSTRVTQDAGAGLYAPNGSLRIGSEPSSSAYTPSGALNGTLIGSTFYPAPGGVVYEPEAVALFARMTTEPDATRKSKINTFIKSLKTSGVWAKLDALYVMAAHDAQAARRNWIADQYNLTPIASPSFTIDRGYKGDGSSSLLSTGFAFATAQQNTAHIGVWDVTELANNLAVAGNETSLIIPRTSGGSLYGRVNGSVDRAVGAVPALVGHAIINRSASNACQGFKNGEQVGTSTETSTSPSSTIMVLLGKSGTGQQFSSHMLPAAHIGASLTGPEVASLYSALQTYLTSVGAI